MKIHGNARMTPSSRALLCERVRRDGWSVTAAATAQGISRQTAHKWLKRSTYDDGSSRPRRQPRRTSAALTAAIIAARYERCTAWTIAVRLQVPRSTVSAILARAGLNRLVALTPREPARRYERQRVGELVHVDMKRVGRIGQVGHRVTGEWRHRVKGMGWETLHVCVDDYSRVAYVEVLADQCAGTAAGFLTRAVRWFARRGVRVERVMTDNGAAYCARRFQHACAARRVRWVRTRPYRPQTNGKAERFIQTLLREWAYATPYRSSWRRTRALAPWLRHYNGARPHAALNYQPPASRFWRAVQ